ncbi:MAG: thiamine-phosphate kinase [Mariprofundaceae bacterium]|nr:thiamine-phosphate kinase [Mariprofundaceae bacterium]
MPASEFSLIEQCFVSKARYQHKHTMITNGDDASVHNLPSNHELVVSTDTAVQGVHWPHDFPLEKAADRAVCAALSDLAAMGAEACWAWVSVVAESTEALQSMGQGVTDALNRYEVELSGGDTVHAPLNSLNITVAGILEKGTAMQRNKANIGDKVWFLGQAGLSALGLQQWLNGQKGGEFISHFSDVIPKIQQGRALRVLGVRCCIDVSDGIFQDANHIGKDSNILMELDVEKFPNWQSLSQELGAKKAMQVMLSGGEDYGLLFTAPAHTKGLNELATWVGVCLQGSGVKAQYKGEDVQLVKSGYDHFAV